MSSGGWIGVDLDGTLAEYDGWQGAENIGKPVEKMKQRVLDWIAAGIKVKIMTARCIDPQAVPPIKQWLLANGIPDLEITNQKDYSMWELWDDRAVQIIPNTGERADGKP